MPRPLTSLLKLSVAACACLLPAGARAQAAADPATRQSAAQVRPTGDAARGVDLFRRGETDAAVEALRAATKTDKTNAEAWYYLGLALVKQHKHADARKAFEAAIRLRPDYVAALNGLAFALIMRNDLVAANGALQKSLKVEPKNAETHYLLGVIFARSEVFNRALEEAEESAKLDPSYALPLYLKSEALVGMAGKEIAAATDETADVRAALLKTVTSRLDSAQAAIDAYFKTGAQSQDATALAEQIKTMRVYGGLGDLPASERIAFSAKEVTTKAVVLKRPEPTYSEEARRNGTTGQVRLRMVLAADGTVKYIFPLKRLPDGLTERSIEAARRIKFIPATKDGQPVSQFVMIIYSFNIY